MSRATVLREVQRLGPHRYNRVTPKASPWSQAKIAIQSANLRPAQASQAEKMVRKGVSVEDAIAAVRAPRAPRAPRTEKVLAPGGVAHLLVVVPPQITHDQVQDLVDQLRPGISLAELTDALAAHGITWGKWQNGQAGWQDYWQAVDQRRQTTRQKQSARRNAAENAADNRNVLVVGGVVVGVAAAAYGISRLLK